MNAGIYHQLSLSGPTPPELLLETDETRVAPADVKRQVQLQLVARHHTCTHSPIPTRTFPAAAGPMEEWQPSPANLGDPFAARMKEQCSKQECSTLIKSQQASLLAPRSVS